MSITRRIEKLEADFAAEGDLDRTHRAAFPRAKFRNGTIRLSGTNTLPEAKSLRSCTDTTTAAA
jgi:hypothetical protein